MLARYARMPFRCLPERCSHRPEPAGVLQRRARAFCVCFHAGSAYRRETAAYQMPSVWTARSPMAMRYAVLATQDCLQTAKNAARCVVINLSREARASIARRNIVSAVVARSEYAAGVNRGAVL